MDEKEEENSLIKDALGGLRSLLKERSVSPLFPAFIASWLMWNYRIVLTVVSDEDLETKFSVIDKMFPTIAIHLINGILIPLLIALAYIYIYPWISLPIYSFSLNRQRELREARQKADKEKLLSEEDKEKILAFAYDQKVKSQRQLDQQLQEIEQLNAKINDLEKNNKPISSDMTKLDLGTQKTSEQEYKNSESEMPNKRLLSDTEAKILSIMRKAENGGKDFIQDSDIFNAIKEDVDRTDAQIILNELQKSGYINRNNPETGSANCKFTNEGRKAIKEYLDSKKVSSQNPSTQNSSSNKVANQNETNPTENSMQIEFDPKHIDRARNSRLLLTGDQMMRHYIEEFLQNEKSLGNNQFLSSVMDGKVGITMLPKNDRKSMTFNYSYSTDKEASLTSEVNRITSKFLREVDKYL